MTCNYGGFKSGAVAGVEKTGNKFYANFGGSRKSFAWIKTVLIKERCAIAVQRIYGWDC